jgi:hypothetical protein
MDTYTISKRGHAWGRCHARNIPSTLAFEVNGSVDVVRDYVMRGPLYTAQRADSGYAICDAQALFQLRFVCAAFEAAIRLA